MNVFCEWQKSCDDQGSPVPDILKQPYDCGAVSYWLVLFVTEARKDDDEQYPPRSLYQVACGILHFMCAKDPCAPNFLDQIDG